MATTTIIKSVRVAYPVGQSSESWLTAPGASGQGWRMWPGTWEGLQGIHAVQQRGGKDCAEARYFVPSAGVLSVHLEEIEETKKGGAK